MADTKKDKSGGVSGIIDPCGLAPAQTLDGMKYCIVRTYTAGVFAGYVESRERKTVTIREARRIWQWKGAATLSQLATYGTSIPDGCKFPPEVGRITVTEAIEILECTEKARESIKGVPVWME